ncbi:hypothetical protein PLESTM_001482900 [Pleodorina starrii]|nr:hypothetical protein PLESTM_001482900 [Pleodorina starrii]
MSQTGLGSRSEAMGKSKLVRPSFLSCFSCGLAELPGDGSNVAAKKPNGDAPTIGPAPICCKDGANGASGSLASPLGSNRGSRPATAESCARRPSTAFRESSPLQRGTSPARKSGVTSAAVGEDAAAPPSAPTIAPGTPPQYLVTAGAATALAAVNTLSDCEAFPSRRQPRKPHVRTSRVSPAYDTEDELSPAVLSRSPSGSVDESSFPSYSPSLEDEPLRDAYGETNGAETDDADTDGATALTRGRGPVTDADSREASGDGGGDAAAGFGVQVLAFPGASVGGTVLLSTATGASGSPSAAERPGPVPGGGGGPAAAAAAAAAARVAPVAAADGDGALRTGGGGGGGAVTARRGSFAGDSSTSLVGPASVSTPPEMRNCPSLRPTARGSSPPPSPSPQPLGQCVSLRLSPLPLPPPPPAAAALETCGSLRLSPLSPQRLLAPSPSLHPTPLLPSPSLNRRPPSQDLDLLMLLPGAQASETSPATHGSAAGDQMLRLAPPQPPQPLLQDSPCSLERSAFPRANTLAPLPVENTAALNRLASLQAAFKGRQLLGSQPTAAAAAAAALHPSDDAGGSGDEDTAARDAVDECWPSPATHGSAAAADASMVPLWLEAKPHWTALSERAGGAAAAAMAAAAADACAIAAAAAAAKTTSAAVARSGAGTGGDNQHKKDEYDEYDDDVASMVSHLLPPSCFRSSAPAVPYGGGAALAAVTIEQHVRRTGSLVHPGPATAAAAADAAKAKCTAPLSDPGAPAPPPPPAAVAGLVSEPALGSDPASLETHAVKWLEELLPPPSPGYRSSNGPMGRSNLGLPAAGRRPAAMQAADSFKCLMQEIE